MAKVHRLQVVALLGAVVLSMASYGGGSGVCDGATPKHPIAPQCCAAVTGNMTECAQCCLHWPFESPGWMTCMTVCDIVF